MAENYTYLGCTRFSVRTPFSRLLSVPDGFVRARWRPTISLTTKVNTGRWTLSERRRLTALIEREGDGFVSVCPEVGVASQGDTIEEARANLQEAVELFFETASRAELEGRLHGEVYVTTVEVAIA
jgi:predicted RNase H-like HicB family nuclease